MKKIEIGNPNPIVLNDIGLDVNFNDKNSYFDEYVDQDIDGNSIDDFEVDTVPDIKKSN